MTCRQELILIGLDVKISLTLNSKGNTIEMNRCDIIIKVSMKQHSG